MFSSSDISLTSQGRVFPLPRPSTKVTTPLSILDATVAAFAPTSAVWFFDAPSSDPSAWSSSLHSFNASLQKTLASYPQWAGQLSPTPYNPHGGHTERFRRLVLIHGTPHDPGVEFVTATCKGHSLASLVPSAEERTALRKGWDASNLPFHAFLPETMLALDGIKDTPGLPGMVIQITLFKCGGIAIALKLCHPLADAHALASFIHDWAKVHRAVIANVPESFWPELKPCFDPQLLDRAAAGNIDAVEPDEELIKKARDLPSHRHDWWASEAGAPDWAKEQSKVPAELDPEIPRSSGVPIPWSTWDGDLPAAHAVLHFTGEEVENMWLAASREQRNSSSSIRISRHDAVVAFIWTLINRARNLTNDNNPVYVDMSLGLRPRLSPPLPEHFIGSPMIIAAITSSGAQASDPSLLGISAANIRSTIARFDSGAVSAVLHDMAHEICPQRIWQCFVGQRHTILTSWIHLHVYKVDFGTGLSPRFVGAVMPVMDGVVEIMEAAPGANAGNGIEPRQWSTDGVDIDLNLEKGVTERLMGDSLLRKYRCQDGANNVEF